MSLGTLTIDLAASTARLSSDLGKASRLSDKYADDMKRRMDRVGKIVGAAVAGLATGAFAGWIKSSIDAADAASKTAQSVGVSIEALTGLQFAADLSGVATNELTSSLGKFNKTIDQADRGSKQQAEACADMGLALRDTNGDLKSADSLLLEVADKFSGYEDGAAKAALAQELFGKSGAKLIPLLNSGSQGIQGLTDQAKQLGLVISQETASAAEQFNDSLSVLGKLSDGVANQVSADMLPVMNDFTGLLIDLSTNSDAAADSANVLSGILKGLATVGIVIGATFKTAGEALGSVAAALVAAAKGDFKGAWATIQEGAKDYTETTEAAIARIKKLWSGDYAQAGAQAAAVNKTLRESIQRTTLDTEGQAASTKKSTDAIGSQIAALQLQAETLGMTSQQSTLYKLALDGATESQLASANAALEQVAAFEKSQGDLEDHQKLVEEIAAIQEGTWSDASKALLEYQKKVETLRKGLFSGAISQESYDSTIEALEAQSNKAEEVSDEMSEFAKSAAQNMQSAFADFLFDPFEGGLEGMAQNFGKIIQRMIAEQAAAQIFESMGSFGKANSGASGATGIFASIAGFFGGGKAIGGPAMAGKMYEVGEYNRPELFTSGGRQYMIPGNSGSVSPMGGGGGGNVFNFDLSGMKTAKEAREASGALQRSVSRAVAGGGRYA